MADLGIDYGQFGVLLGLYLTPGIVLALPGGLLGRRFGDKRVVVLGLGLMATGGLAMALGGSYTLVVTGRILGGAGAILLNVLVTKMIADWFVDRGLVTAMAILVTSWPLGIGLAMVTLPALAEAWSWQAAMVLTTILSLAGLAAVAVVYRAPPLVADERKAQPIRFRLGRRELFLVLLAGLIWALFNVTFAIIPGFAPGLLVSSGYTVVEANSMVSVVSWLLLLSLPLGGSLAERLARPNLVLVTCFTGLGLLSFLLALWPFPFPILVALGLLFGPPAGIIMALPVEVLHADQRAPGMGLFLTCYYVAMPALTALAGFSLDASANPAVPLFLGGLLMVVAIISLALFRRMQRAGAQG
jgi:predicted MFS family arabinose efflux permease